MSTYTNFEINIKLVWYSTYQKRDVKLFYLKKVLNEKSTLRRDIILFYKIFIVCGHKLF